MTIQFLNFLKGLIGVIVKFLTGDPCASQPCQYVKQSKCKKINGFSHECIASSCDGELCCDEEICCVNGSCNHFPLNETFAEMCRCSCYDNFAGETIYFGYILI